MTFQDILAAIAVVINGLPQGLLALTYGFAAFPTALAFIVGVGGMALFGQVAPISFQAETIVLAGTLGNDRTERLNIVFYTGIIMIVIGGVGLLEPIIDFIGPTILNGMMAGVGIMLAKVGIDMFRQQRVVGAISGVVAIVVYFMTNNLVYTIVASVFASSAYSIYANRNASDSNVSADLSMEKFERIKFKVNSHIIRSVLAVTTLQIGGNIAYASITASIAGAPVNVDQVTVYSGIASAVSALFGGGPVETIISGTGAAPNPQISGMLMMGLMAIILLLKLLPKIAKYVPSQSIAGFLFVLGAIVVFPINTGIALQGEPVVAGVTTVVTAFSDPFIGMVAGVAVRFLLAIF